RRSSSCQCDARRALNVAHVAPRTARVLQLDGPTMSRLPDLHAGAPTVEADDDRGTTGVSRQCLNRSAAGRLEELGRDGGGRRRSTEGERCESDRTEARRPSCHVSPLGKHRLYAARRRLPMPGSRYARRVAATPMRGKPLADRIRSVVAEEVRAIGHIGLVTVLVGDDPASDLYIRLKHKAAVEAGFDTTDLRLPETTSQHDLLAKLAE